MGPCGAELLNLPIRQSPDTLIHCLAKWLHANLPIR
jgi:hypothetical protein